ncbi:MAG: ferredoxin [Acidimicrobiia bacterium]
MRIVVDWDLCESNAVCVARAPEIFEIDDDEQLVVKIEHPGEELRAKAEAALQGCPRRAIAITED